MPQGAGNSGNVVRHASRKSNESSNGFEEAATFTATSPDAAPRGANGSQDTQRGQEAQRIRSKWKRELFLLFEDPSSSPSAFVINVFVTFMIIFSAVLTTIETIPALRKGNSQMWLALELIIVAVFTLEFVLRFLGHTDSWRQAWDHTKSFVTVVDALAIFPFYLEMAFQRDTSYEFRFTILRIFRLLRVFSAFKYSSLLQLSIEVMIVAIKRSSDALLAFLLFVTLTVLLFRR
ncbi:hypothetical protein BX661DRAFT_169898 [Kickxella alabastrina]|uniref:uncharacterized protein n=1 Tax=Kickxella alabastrina TaxID=61397 RepID=UPI00221F1164|nr:uncharacterized protein BX661DRAFT_169898 [Kickxella alabastrina]KAI7832065.1 hypothetical protein BX661DRAFT_169898 [Kickxella alabastrina]